MRGWINGDQIRLRYILLVFMILLMHFTMFIAGYLLVPDSLSCYSQAAVVGLQMPQSHRGSSIGPCLIV
jgi:hypothetical protein